jgi:hypothetical protein
MKSCQVAAAMAAVLVLAPSLAQARCHHRGYCNAPYGNGSPAYQSRYGTYPSSTYDPDPVLRAQLRMDFNRGVNSTGGR